MTSYDEFGNVMAHNEFGHVVAQAWRRAAAGEIETARKLYRAGDAMGLPGRLDPDLSVLRHSVGEASGKVVSISATEDRIVCFGLPPAARESADGHDMKSPVIDPVKISAGVESAAGFDPGYHRRNISREMPHVLFMSTGRCGTRSIERFLMPADVFAYHDYWWMQPTPTRLMQMCALLAGGFNSESATQWLETRAAEWLGAISRDRVFVGLNHLDTVFAPIFIAMHPKAKIVHLHRDEMGVFDSFVRKDQWQNQQLRPVNYSFEPCFRFRRTGHDLTECMAWYLHFTATLADAVEAVLGDRFLRVSADRLFAGDADEIGRMLDFIGIDLPHREFPHINEKAHKIVVDEKDMPPAREAFMDARERLRAAGRLRQ